MWPVEASAPWWILTNYADQNDVMTLLDGAIVIGYILVVAMFIGSFVGACVALSTRLLGPWSWARFHHIVQSFIPLAGCGVFLGLSMTTVTLLRHDGLDLGFVEPLRAAMLVGACVWSLWLAFRIAALHAETVPRQVLAMFPIGLAVAASTGAFVHKRLQDNRRGRELVSGYRHQRRRMLAFYLGAEARGPLFAEGLHAFF
jgi:hypothetical protein